MEESLKQKLLDDGIDVDDALSRFMNNEKLLLRMLKKFKEEPSYSLLMDAYEKKDAKAALAASHSMKGVCGNLSIKALYELTAKQVDLFRHDDPDAAFAMMDEIVSTYKKTIDAIDHLFATTEGADGK